MGQQQLILLVLATVIVGIAIIVGIRAFNENSIKANYDALTQDAVRIANDAQAWKQKPAPFGGQQPFPIPPAADARKIQPTDFTPAVPADFWGQLGYNEAAAGEYHNLNGVFTIAGSAAGLRIHACSPVKGNLVVIEVRGLDDVTITANTATSVLGAPVPYACTAATAL